MWWNEQRANAVTGGVWLIGLGILFATHFWWPGILLLAGVTALVQGSVRGLGVRGIHGGLWLILIALWALSRFSLAVLFVSLGIYVVVAALIRPDEFRKPYVDQTLE